MQRVSVSITKTMLIRVPLSANNIPKRNCLINLEQPLVFPSATFCSRTWNPLEIVFLHFFSIFLPFYSFFVLVCFSLFMNVFDRNVEEIVLDVKKLTSNLIWGRYTIFRVFSNMKLIDVVASFSERMVSAFVLFTFFEK